MFLLLEWIRKRRKERQLLKETKVLEANRRIQLEKRDHQQAQALLLALHELQRTVDPLIATQVYNNRFCPLTRLPEELLLHILDFLEDDAATVHCLRIVSRVFLRLVDHQLRIWSRPWYTFDGRWKTPGSLKLDLQLQFRRLLQRDGRCDNCTRWNNRHCSRTSDDCKFQQRYRRYDDAAYVGLYSKLYCAPCNTRHDVCQFSIADQLPWNNPHKRRCLGQQGSVQLCEHVQITWVSIKSHIDDWRQQRQQHWGGDWKACLDSFNIECHDASHDTRCTASEAPTWPRASLHSASLGIVVLTLEWEPHSRIDELGLTADGRIPAQELRALFQRLRRIGPANTLYPPGRPGSLPEMGFFSPSARLGPFVYYKTGEDDKIPPERKTLQPMPLEPHPWPTSYYDTVFHTSYGLQENDRKIQIRPHYLKGAGGTGITWQCFITSYKKDIMVCETTAITNPAVEFIPTDYWLHAMDTRTYPHPRARQIRPQCREETCSNYYERGRDFCTCDAWPDHDAVLALRRAYCQRIFMGASHPP